MVKTGINLSSLFRHGYIISNSKGQHPVNSLKQVSAFNDH
jgi:hypothetical protein